MAIYLLAGRAHLPIIQHLENRYRIFVRWVWDNEYRDETRAAQVKKKPLCATVIKSPPRYFAISSLVSSS